MTWQINYVYCLNTDSAKKYSLKYFLESNCERVWGMLLVI